MNNSTKLNNIDKLKELTSSLSNFPEPIEGTNNGYREYKMDKGNCFAWYIHRSGDDIAIHRWFNSKGSKFPAHQHKEKEWLIVYKGTIIVHKNNKYNKVSVGEMIYNAPCEEHSASFPEDCKYITIMMPPAKEFPNGE